MKRKPKGEPITLFDSDVFHHLITIELVEPEEMVEDEAMLPLVTGAIIRYQGHTIAVTRISHIAVQLATFVFALSIFDAEPDIVFSELGEYEDEVRLAFANALTRIKEENL